MEKDLVKITCYGETQVYERSKAKKEFSIALASCDKDSHEGRRYAYILDCLHWGDTEIDDEYCD